MILQELAAYYDRLAADQETNVAPPGFQQKQIDFVIVLNPDGSVSGVQDTRTAVGKRLVPASFIVPKERSDKTGSKVAPNFLWENNKYALGFLPDSEAEKIERQKGLDKLAQVQARVTGELFPAFVDQVREVAAESDDEGLTALYRFLTEHRPSLESLPEWDEIKAGPVNIAFRLAGDQNLICQRPEVRPLALSFSEALAGDEEAMCLITGERGVVARLHDNIKGVRGGQSSGGNIVSFNLAAFRSQGKDQSYNAPVGVRAMFAYTTALNTLLAKDSRQKIQVGDATTVFWAEKRHQMEEVFAKMFGETPAGEDSTQDAEEIKALFRSPERGAAPLLDDQTRFMVLGLSPNSSRIAVRFWHRGTVAQVAQAIKRHYDDLALDHAPHQPDYLPLRRLLASTAVEGKLDNVPPNLAGEVMRAILAETPYPRSLLVAALNRAKAEQARKDKRTGKPLPNVSYPRAALIKAFLVRQSRFYGYKGKEVDVSLDPANTNPGYLLGRLFAALEQVQFRANPNLNRTIRDSFYSSASATPAAVFPRLMRLKNHHLAKLENRGEVVNLEKLIGSIIADLTDFPAHLNLADQGRFAVGYYHQRQDFFTKKTTTDADDIEA